MERPKGMPPRKGFYPDADPTAPGGMSQAELVDELTKYHGWTREAAEDLLWPEQIDAACQGRLDREREQKEAKAQKSDDIFDEFEQAADERQAESLFLGMPGSLDYVFDGHAGASPSGAERWMSCTASVGAVRKFLETLSPNQQKTFAEASLAARQGTTAHAAAEAEANFLLGRIDEEEKQTLLLELAVIPEDEGEAYDSEMAEYITEYTDLIRQYADERGAESILIETRVAAVVPLTGDHEDDIHEIRGSADAVALPVKGNPDLTVIDLKYGQGIDVEVDENPQARIYALGVLDSLTDDEGLLTLDVETITYYIVQPRLGGIKTWTESVDDLLDWRDEVLAPALTAAVFGKAAGATFAPSDAACQWCPIQGTCSALVKQRMEAGRDLFDVVSAEEAENGIGAIPNLELLSDEEIAEYLTQITGLVALHKAMKEEATRRAHRGRILPGWKMVSYTPRRTWSPEANEVLNPDHPDDWEAAMWSRKLLTPTQALAALETMGYDGKETLGDLVITPDKRPVLAPEGDRRKTWTGKPPEEMFDVE